MAREKIPSESAFSKACRYLNFSNNAKWLAHLSGAAAATPVSMVDNGTTLVLVDGSSSGYTVDLGTNAFGTFLAIDRALDG